MAKISTYVYVGAAVVSAYFTYKIFKAAADAGQSIRDYLKTAPTSVPGAGVFYNGALAIGGAVKDTARDLLTPSEPGIVANVVPDAQAAADAISNGAPYVPQTHPYAGSTPNGLTDAPQSASGPTTQSNSQLTGSQAQPTIIPLGY